MTKSAKALLAIETMIPVLEFMEVLKPKPELREPAVVSHEVEHSLALVGLVAGAVIGGFIAFKLPKKSIFSIADGIGTGAAIGEFLGSQFSFGTGEISSGAATVLIEGKKAARAEDFVNCWMHSVSQIAQGSETVAICKSPASRKGEKLTCGAIIREGVQTVKIGGPSADVLAIADEVPEFIRDIVLVCDILALKDTAEWIATGLFFVGKKAVGAIKEAGLATWNFIESTPLFRKASDEIVDGIENITEAVRKKFDDIAGGGSSEAIEEVSEQVRKNVDDLGLGGSGSNAIETISEQTQKGLDDLNLNGGARQAGDQVENISDRIQKNVDELEINGKNSSKSPDGQSCSNRCTDGDPIDVATGQVVEVRTDFQIDATIPLVLKRTYLTGLKYSGQLGKGWADTWGQKLRIVGETCEFFTDEGQILFFELPQGNGSGRNPHQPHLTLVRYRGHYALYDHLDQKRYGFFCQDGEWMYLSEIADRNGNVVAFDRDEHGNVREVLHSDGHRLRVTMEDGFIRKIEQRGSQGQYRDLMRYEQDTHGRLIAAEGVQSTRLQYEYDDRHRLVCWLDQKETWARYEYDDHDRVSFTNCADGRYTGRFEYQPDQRQTHFYSEEAGRRTYFYNSLGLVTRQEDELGLVRTTLWDQWGQYIGTKTPSGRRTTRSLDEYGRVVAVVGPDQLAKRFFYSSAGDLRCVALPEGSTWHMAYDSWGNRLSVTDPTGAVTKYEYNRQGRLKAVTKANGASTRYQYDQLLRPIAVTNAKGEKTSVRYDEFSRIIDTTDPEFVHKEYQYDAWDRIVGVNYPAANPLDLGGRFRQAFEYDIEGNLARFTNGKGHSEAFEFGSFDLLRRKVDAKGNEHRFFYDGEIRLTKVQNSRGEAYRYEYDQRGNVILEQDFSGRIHRYEYDLDGLCVAKINSHKETTTYHYNAAGRLEKEVSHSGGETRYSYDLLGRMIRATSPTADVEFKRDLLGRVISEKQNGRIVESRFDECGNRVTRVTDSGHLTRFEFDRRGLLKRLQLPFDQGLDFRYNGRGQELQRKHEKGFILRQSYNSWGLLKQQTVGRHVENWVPHQAQPAKRKIVPSMNRLFSYDHHFNLTKVEENDHLRATYRYDQNDQILSAEYGNGVAEAFSYNGNLDLKARSVTVRGGSVPIQAEARDRIINYQKGSRFASDGVLSYRYDEEGRVIEKREEKPGFRPQVWAFEWNESNQVQAVRTPSGQTWKYTYDPFGRRLEKRCGQSGTKFLWDGDVLAEEVPFASGTDASAKVWVFEPGQFVPMACQQGSKAAYVVTDHLGTPVEMYREDGDVVWSGSLGVWGDQHRAEGRSDGEAAWENPFRFQGQMFDSESGLHYNRHRYYDPSSSQYISPDPIGLEGGFRPQGYVEKPCADFDPLGLNRCEGNPSVSLPSDGKWSPTKFADGKLEDHFQKHSHEWGLGNITIEGYEKRAHSLLSKVVDGNILGFTSKQGTVFRYNNRTNEFATAKPDGTIETLFRPIDGFDYFQRQIIKYGKN
ncbi:RHS repeat-associated core domain-containing protein [Acanthopleuribacter pedis]|uniref:PAAR/RHS domain-containing protein n=1 Tax=Acanthopleuribacter pedis TaxID=442870 RepID=A0A8J7Q2Z3_9BACT|nr:RHS repeat-associated core domain-containing protein [Acanthopleuribacter pedis]MBO1318285.1 PAAR/RHS domain-containing protein [Acanthopleuribacter pedis]